MDWVDIKQVVLPVALQISCLRSMLLTALAILQCCQGDCKFPCNPVRLALLQSSHKAKSSTVCFPLGPEGQKVLLISLPRFSSSGTLILVNLKTLAVHPIQFDADISA